MRNRKLFQKVLFLLLASAAFSTVAAGQKLPEPRQERLLNGLKLLMWPDARADKVWVRIRIHSGSAFDPQGKEGVMKLLSDSFFPNETAREFFTDDLGGSLEIVSNYDYIQVNASSKPDQFMTMLETLATAISNPTIDKETTAKLRTALLANVTALEADPAYIADQAVAKRLFGTFPYGRPRLGSSESLKRIDFPDLLDAKQRFMTADDATVAISGNFDPAVAFRGVRRYFGSWLKSDKMIPSTFRQPDEPDTKPLQIEIPNLTNSYSRTAKNAPARPDKDYYPMLVFSEIRSAQPCSGVAKYQANLLRGIYISQEDRKFSDLPVVGQPCPVLLQKKDGGVIYPQVPRDDFESAKARVIAAIQNHVASADGIAALWLDVDTYKLESPDDEMRKAMAVTLVDVRAVSEKLYASPSVRVTVNPPLKSGQ